MRKRLLLLAPLLAGCSSALVNGRFASPDPAPAGALACAAREMGRLHYTLTPSGNLAADRIRGERNIYIPSGKPDRSVGEVIVSLVRIDSMPHLRVDAQRYAPGSEAIAAPGPMGGGPGGGIGDGGVPRPEEAVSPVRRGGRRLSLGPVHGDVSAILNSCIRSNEAGVG